MKMDAKTVKLVQETWVPVYALGVEGALIFYGKLFEADASIKNLFRKSDLKAQAASLFKMLNAAVEGLDNVGDLVPVLKDLGRRHVEYRVRPEHYPVVGGALLDTLAVALGPKWTPEVKAAWVAVYTVVADTMIEGALLDPDCVKLGYKPKAAAGGVCPVPHQKSGDSSLTYYMGAAVAVAVLGAAAFVLLKKRA